MHFHYCCLFLVEKMMKVALKTESTRSDYKKLHLKINKWHNLTLEVEFRVKGSWFINNWEELSEVFVFTEKLLHAKDQIENHFHCQTSILVEVLMHQKNRIAPAYPLFNVIKKTILPPKIL